MGNKIYTKGGDKGATSLVGGTRKLKSDSQIDLYGDVDELNSFIGAVLVYKEDLLTEDKELLFRLQHVLFDLGALMACEMDKRETFKLNKIENSFIQEIEQSIDRIDSMLEPLRKFIMPRGGELATRLHIARTVTRRVERKLVEFETQRPEQFINNANILLNRLSDYLFILARYILKEEKESEVIWKK
jgi:cob(I)alamin adenosyltransferase